eukprot:CAMPEP_0179275576 /NCGR_PEP_ID=MMETSP0797-20121207/34135_1 /TAXON_ID=47934 /ORGANISM="Dinophysis acuminata, Strain DAEP01" /LENGTH=53 /DNA_ID=CAMNT_0020984109 /DNA_START=74 /DNA_END=231 /DNA_ORIENTATION=-
MMDRTGSSGSSTSEGVLMARANADEPVSPKQRERILTLSVPAYFPPAGGGGFG